jgi:hypothetical protein
VKQDEGSTDLKPEVAACASQSLMTAALQASVHTWLGVLLNNNRRQ